MGRVQYLPRLIDAFDYSNARLGLLERDVLMIISHLYLNKNSLYLSIDNILEFQGRKKIKNSRASRGGFHKIQRIKIREALLTLIDLNLVCVFEYLPNKFMAAPSSAMLLQPLNKIKLDSKALNYQPKKEFLEKDFAYRFGFYKNKKFQINISKLLKNKKISSPLEIRNRFEDALCRLVEDGVIKSWDYKEIDEDLLLDSKNWFYYWNLLSIKISK